MPLRCGGWPESDILEWQRSGADAPCAMDAYDADVEARIRKTENDALFVVCTVILAALVVGSLLYFLHFK